MKSHVTCHTQKNAVTPLDHRLCPYLPEDKNPVANNTAIMENNYHDDILWHKIDVVSYFRLSANFTNLQ